MNHENAPVLVSWTMKSPGKKSIWQSITTLYIPQTFIKGKVHPSTGHESPEEE